MMITCRTTWFEFWYLPTLNVDNMDDVLPTLKKAIKELQEMIDAGVEIDYFDYDFQERRECICLKTDNAELGKRFNFLEIEEDEDDDGEPSEEDAVLEELQPGIG